MTKYFLARARQEQGESGEGRGRPCRHGDLDKLQSDEMMETNWNTEIDFTPDSRDRVSNFRV